MQKHLLALSISALSLTSSFVNAAPSAFTDARSFAMGGVGVASSQPAAASFFNPALLAVKHRDSKDGFGLIIPSANITVADEDDLIDDVDKIQQDKLFDKFSNAIDAAKANPNSANIQNAIDATNNLNTALKGINQDTARADIGAGIAIAIPGNNFAGALFIDATSKAVITTNYRDGVFLDQILTDLNNGQSGNLPSNPEDLLTSDVTGIGAGMAEAGIALATSFDMNGSPVAVGVTPKWVELVSYKYVASANKFEDNNIDSNDYETTSTEFNLDLGVAMMFGAQNEWTAGFAIRNLIPMDIKTVPGGPGLSTNTIDIKPNVKVGIAHQSDIHTIAIDLDVTPNKAFSFEDDTQLIAIGAEFNAWDWAQLRIGGRYNIASDVADDGSRGTLTTGFGISPFGVHLDVAALANQNELGVAAELGFTF
ncbi:MAG: conjugal transfer protein TraF [Hahellaceae bacterium]|nr:conjugal transfer protein TraF [Hahellaceae bacterium]MCP5168684.1 conjugal transfer protein TraF [Hahellaceae bacterium]